MDGYSIMLLLGVFCWIVSSSGESRNDEHFNDALKRIAKLVKE